MSKHDTCSFLARAIKCLIYAPLWPGARPLSKSDPRRLHILHFNWQKRLESWLNSNWHLLHIRTPYFESSANAISLRARQPDCFSCMIDARAAPFKAQNNEISSCACDPYPTFHPHCVWVVPNVNLRKPFPSLVVCVFVLLSAAWLNWRRQRCWRL